LQAAIAGLCFSGLVPIDANTEMSSISIDISAEPIVWCTSTSENSLCTFIQSCEQLKGQRAPI